MDRRQEQLLCLVIDNYIKAAEPVGSRFLVQKAGLDWSEATVRNELRLLEEEGYLTHPHTSAGRIPTVAGYRFYLDHAELDKEKLPRHEGVALEKSASGAGDYETARKCVARTLVDLSAETVLIAFTPERVYYTGLSNLFQKPDFAEMRLVTSVSQVFDRCEEYLPDFFEKVSDQPQYFLGGEHPFGEILSILSMRFGRNRQSLIALIGPQRMNYRHNWGLIKKAQELI